MRAAVVFLLPMALLAGVRPAPLPEAVANAQVIWLVNLTNEYKTFDYLYAGLMKWGRWGIAVNIDYAKLILFFDEETTRLGTMETNQGAAGAIGGVVLSGGSKITTDYAKTTVFLRVQDEKSGDEVLAFACPWQPDSKRMANCLLKQLKERFR